MWCKASKAIVETAQAAQCKDVKENKKMDDAEDNQPWMTFVDRKLENR